MPSGGSRPGAGRKPVPEEEKRVRLQIYVTPRAKKALLGMSEDLQMPVGQVIEELLAMKGDGR